MGLATVTNTEYGYMVTGDTDATTVNTGRLWVKALAFAGNADDATCAITNDIAGTATSCIKFKINGWDLDCANNFVFFGDKGRPFTKMIVTLGHADDRLYVFLTV